MTTTARPQALSPHGSSAHEPSAGPSPALPGSPPASPPGSSPASPAGSRWPEEAHVAPRPDWRERLALGADLALIGVVTTVLAAPLLTAPAALAAGSAAVRHRYRAGGLPPARPLLRQFRQGLLRGLPVVPLTGALLLDLTAVGRGWVPGGPVLLTLTAAAIAWLGGLAGVILVVLGRAPGTPWRQAVRWAWERPGAVTAVAGTGVLAAFLALSVPATIPLLVGFQLFAAHMISDRLAPDELAADR